MEARGWWPRAIRMMPGMILLSGALLGCQRGGSENVPVMPTVAGNHAPVARAVTLQPHPLTLTGPVLAIVEAQDLDRNPLRFRYSWTVNGTVVHGQNGEQLSADRLKRGDRISVQVWPHDGIVEGVPVTSDTVVVGNTPPQIAAIVVTPQVLEPGGKLLAEVTASDPDHDRIDLAYRWLRNDVVVKEGEEAFFETTGLAPRDKVVVEVTARDSQAAGIVLRSDVVTLGNTLPRIVSTPPVSATLDRYEYAVRATDPDGDRLTYELETAPAGMTIEPGSGQITWVIPPGSRGIFHVKVLAKDGQGGTAYQEFDLAFGVSLSGKPAGA